jgi:fumarate hydratase class II
MPEALVALLIVKRAARVNATWCAARTAEAIVAAADEGIAGRFAGNSHSRSGRPDRNQTNMNVNEVLANRASGARWSARGPARASERRQSRPILE